MAEISYFRRMVDGVPVVAAPAEIGIRFISHFGSLPDALLQQPADPIRPADPPSSAGPGFPHHSKARTGRRKENLGRAFAPPSVPTRHLHSQGLI